MIINPYYPPEPPQIGKTMSAPGRKKRRRKYGKVGGGGTSWSSYWATLLASPNSDIVQWNSIDEVATTGTMLSATPDTDNIIVTYKPERISGKGVITQIRFHNKTMVDVTLVVFHVWRYNGVDYDRICAEDVTALITAGDGVKTITLPNSVNVIEGDYVGLGWEGGNVEINAATAAAPISLRYFQVDNISNPFDWFIRQPLSFKTQIHNLGIAPMIVGIGDSIMESYPLHTSMVDNVYTTVDIEKSWMYKMYDADNRFTYQNCGIGGETITAIEARFNRDVVLKKPKLAVINGGVNDIDTGVAKAVFLAKWKSILDMCAANDIIPIVWKIMPWDNGDNTEMATRDEWNTDLETLFNTYAIVGKKIIDWDSTLGVNRVGGSEGNLWDINSTYANGDGVHLNEAGNAKVAEVVLAQFA